MTGATATSLSPIFALSAEADRQALVVSVHDVAPVTKAAAEKIMTELSHHQVKVFSLLVVPNYHHRGSSMEDPAFVRWLRDLEAQGHEIVIHGYFHERPRRARETLRGMFLTRFYTNDEGEFYDLDYEEAFRRITRARDEFVKAGLQPRGFVAPAWLLSAAGEKAATAAEMEYTTRLTGVRDLRFGDNFHARALTYSVRSSWRRAVSLMWNSALARQIAATRLARVSIHPPDCEHPEIWQQIVQVIDRLAPNRIATTYRDWIADRRTRRGI